MLTDARSEAFDSSMTFLSAAICLKGERSIVLGPDWEPHLQRRSIAYKLAKLIGPQVMFFCGEPDQVIERLDSVPELIRHEVSLIAAPYVLHDFEAQSRAEELMGMIREKFRNASFIAADYMLKNANDTDAISNLQTDIEKDRMQSLGRDAFLREHQVFDLATFKHLFDTRYERVQAISWSSGRGVVLATNDSSNTDPTRFTQFDLRHTTKLTNLPGTLRHGA